MIKIGLTMLGLILSITSHAERVDVVVTEGNTYGPFNIGVTGIESRFVPNGSSHDLVVSEIISGTPASGVLLVNDVIRAINGISITGDRPRVLLGDVITAAEANDGILSLDIERDDIPQTLQITIPIIGEYSATWPLNCAKSDAIVTATADHYASLGINGSNPVNKAFQALFLLSTGDDAYLDEVATYAQSIGSGSDGPSSNWSLGYSGIVLGEYYLRTGDTTVLPSLQGICDKLLEQNIGGAWAANGGYPSIGYADGGILNAAGAPALAALVLGQECGVTLDQAEFEKCLTYFWRFAGRGGLSYGIYQPDITILNGNSKNATMACFLNVLGESDARFSAAAETMAMQVLHAYPAWESGHTGNGLRLGWEALAISLLPATKDSLNRQHNDALKWYFDLCRHPLGGFKKIPSAGSDQYQSRDWGAVAGLIYTAPRKALRLCGGTPTPYSVTTPVPTLGWGNAADDSIFGIDHLAEYGVDDLSIEDLRINQKNADAFSVSYFERYLYHATQIYRNVGARRLADKYNDGDSTALTPLLAALQHSDFRVRREAMYGISSSGIDSSVVGAQALPLVESVLNDPDAALWELHGVLGLLAASDPASIVPHRSRLYSLAEHSDNWMREEVAKAIGALGEEAQAGDVTVLSAMFGREPFFNSRKIIYNQCVELVESLVANGQLTIAEREQLIQTIGRNFLSDPYIDGYSETRHLYTGAQTLGILDAFNDEMLMELLIDEASFWLHQWNAAWGWSGSFNSFSDYADAMGISGAWIIHSFKEIEDKAEYAVYVDGNEDLEDTHTSINALIDTFESSHGFVPYPWNPPVAEAGPNQTMPPVVVLDGGQSTDSDGQIVSWVWELDGELIARGEEVPIYDLPLGIQTLQLRVTDNYGLQSTDTMAVNVSDILNTPPIADAQRIIVMEGGSAELALTGSDANGQAITYAIVDPPTHGMLDGVPPNVTYTASPGYNGSDSFTFTTNDGIEDATPATVEITILSDTGNPPGLYFARQQRYNQGPNPNTQVSLDLSEADTGYTDHIVVFSGFIYDADGHISLTEYIHSEAYFYIDGVLVHSDTQWDVRTSTGDLALAPGWHEIEIRALNHRGTEEAPGIGYDPTGGTNWVALADPGDGSVLRHDGSQAGTNIAPVALGASYITSSSTVLLEPKGSDANLDAYYYTITSTPANGSLSFPYFNGGYLSNPRYQPDAGFVGIETIEYVVNDAQAESTTGAIKVSVVHEWTPEAMGQSFIAAEGIQNWITLEAVDANGQELSYEVLTQPANGTLTGNAPDLRYEPTPGYNGPDSFTFRAYHGSYLGEAQTVYINVVQDLNWVTLVSDDFEGPAWGSYASDDGANVASNFEKASSGEYVLSMKPGNQHSVELVNPIDISTPGYDVIRIDFQLATTATSSGSGFDVDFFDGTTWHTIARFDNIHATKTLSEFTYKDNGASLHKTIYIEARDYNFSPNMKIAFRSGPIGTSRHHVYLDDIVIRAATSGGRANVRPTAYSQSLIANPGGVEITLAAIDPDDDPLSYNYTNPSHGSLSGVAPNLTYTPNMDYSGPDSFTFWANDGTGDSNIASIGILADQDVASNNAPIANDQMVFVNEGQSVALTLTGRDGDGDPLTFSIATDPTKGTVTGTPPDIVYQSTPGQVGSDSFSFVPNDGLVDGASGTISVTIYPDTQPPLPNASRWYEPPRELGPGSVTMTAQSGFEISGVEYYFECVAGTGHDSGWQDSATYVDTNLSRGQTYTYTVRARDKSAAQNETTASVAESVTIDGGISSPLGNGLIAYWKFDEMSGMTLEDHSGWGHHGDMHIDDADTYPELIDGVLEGGVEFYPEAEYGVGNGFRIDSGGPDLPTAFSISFWIFPKSPQRHATILSQRGETTGLSYRLELEESGWHIDFECPGTTTLRARGWNPPDWTHDWVHVVLTWDSQSGLRRFYVNNEIVAEDYNAVAVPPSDLIASDRLLMMGYYSQSFGSGNPNGQNYLSAHLDDLAIWSRILTDDEIAWLYNEDAGHSVAISEYTFEAWINRYLVYELKGFDDDFDNDGLANGIEAILGTNPEVADTRVGNFQSNGLTTTMTHPIHEPALIDVLGSYEWSLDLQNWYMSDGIDGPLSGATVTSAVTTVDGMATITLTSSELLPQIFVRLSAASE